MRIRTACLLIAAAGAGLGIVFSTVPPLEARSGSAQRTGGASAAARPDSEWADCAGPDGAPPDASKAARGRAQIMMRNGMLGLDVRGCTLADLLPLIAARTGVRITFSEELPPQPRTLRVSPLPVDAALRELLRDTDLFTLYTARTNGEQRLAAVWVYPRGAARNVEPIPAELWASSGDLERQLAHASSEVRARAIEELVSRGGETALPRVLEALADSSADVRQRALDAALGASLEIPASELRALVLYDVSPEVRLRALQAVEELPDSMWIIEGAAADPDANVRTEAQNMLQRVKRAPR